MRELIELRNKLTKKKLLIKMEEHKEADSFTKAFNKGELLQLEATLNIIDEMMKKIFLELEEENK